jgi:hypothetical protein
MDFEAIKAWFERWTGKEANSCRLKGILGLTLMPVALAVALTLVYWLLRLFTHDAAHNLGDRGDSSASAWVESHPGITRFHQVRPGVNAARPQPKELNCGFHG